MKQQEEREEDILVYHQQTEPNPEANKAMSSMDSSGDIVLSTEMMTLQVLNRGSRVEPLRKYVRSRHGVCEITSTCVIADVFS